MRLIDTDAVKKSTNKHNRDLIVAGLITAAIIMIVLLQSTSYLVLLAIMAIAIALLPDKIVRLDVCDYIIVGFCLYLVVRAMIGFSVAPVKRSEMIVQYSLLGVSYLLSRKLCLNSMLVERLTTQIYWVAIIFLGWSVISFVIRRYQLGEIGFSDSFDFRFMNTPWGYPNNCLGLIAVELSCVALFSRKDPFMLLILLTCAVITTFSKGTYLAYACFVICLFITGKKECGTKAKVGVLISSCAGCFLLLPEIRLFADSLMHYSNSASYHWRTDLPSLSYGASLLYGNGPGSYSMVAEHYNAETFTNSAPNLLSQSLIEVGLIGTGFCLVIVFMLLRMAVGSMKTRGSSIVISLIVFCVIKECTQGFLMSSFPACVLLVSIIGGYNSAVSNKATTSLIKWKSSFCLSVKSLFFIGIMALVLWHIELYRFSCLTEGQKLETVYERNSDDLYPAVLLAASGKISLDSCRPPLRDNPFVRVMYGNSLYHDGRKDAALVEIAEAITMHPPLIHSDVILNIVRCDPSFGERLKLKLIYETQVEMTPKAIARYGYILKYYNHQKADAFLRQAVSLAPNLSTPWLLLGDEEKFAYIKYRVYSNLITSDCNMFEPSTIYDEVKSMYRDRFFKWYGYEL